MREVTDRTERRRREGIDGAVVCGGLTLLLYKPDWKMRPKKVVEKKWKFNPKILFIFVNLRFSPLTFIFLYHISPSLLNFFFFPNS